MHLKVNSIYKSYERSIGKYLFFIVVGIERDGDNDSIVKIKMLEEDEQDIEEHVWAFSDYIVALQNPINCEPSPEKQCTEYTINPLRPSVKVNATDYPCAGRDCCVPLNNSEAGLGDIDCLSQIPITYSQETGEKECVWGWVGGDTIPNFPNEQVKSIQLSSLRLGDAEQIFKV